MSRDIPRMVVVSPHPDDSVLGAGGSMARFARSGGEVTVLTIAAHMPPLFSAEVCGLTLEEAEKAHALIGVKESIFLEIPALSVPAVPHPDLNRRIAEVLRRIQPHVILMPYLDRNVDHRAVFESVMVVSRPEPCGTGAPVVAAYEILSSTHYTAPHIEANFTPNWIVDIGSVMDLKLEAAACLSSQIGPVPHPRSCEALRALALFRGSQAGMTHGEGFHVIRMTTPPEALA